MPIMTSVLFVFVHIFYWDSQKNKSDIESYFKWGTAATSVEAFFSGPHSKEEFC